MLLITALTTSFCAVQKYLAMHKFVKLVYFAKVYHVNLRTCWEQWEKVRGGQGLVPCSGFGPL